SLQLWVNLPSDKKMTAPRYQNLLGNNMPVREEAGASVKVFSGNSMEVVSATKNHVPVTMVEIELEAGASISQDLPGGYNGFIYIIEGSGTFGASRKQAEKGQVLWLGSADGTAKSEIDMIAI